MPPQPDCPLTLSLINAIALLGYVGIVRIGKSAAAGDIAWMPTVLGEALA